MDLQNAKICFLSAYAAEYAGNFILMLKALSRNLKNNYHADIFFIFPEQPEHQWIKDLRREYTVSFTKLPYTDTTNEIYKYLQDWKINLAHSHFESYDIPLSKAVKRTGRDIKQVWHLHDYVEVDKSGKTFRWLKEKRAAYLYWKHYALYGKNAYLVGVSHEVLASVEQFKKSLFRYPKVMSIEELQNMSFVSGEVVINGIDTNRLKGEYFFPKSEVTFLSFGGEITRKGIPLIFDAAEMLYCNFSHFRVIITRGKDVDSYIKSRYCNNIPEWLKIVDQTDEISRLFNNSHCYISAARRETMSMAIAEASIYGLPVIQSDIPGTWWNANSPSVFLFKDGDVGDLCKRMYEFCMSDLTELKRKCLETQRKNKDLLSLDKWCDRIVDIYTKKI